MYLLFDLIFTVAQWYSYVLIVAVVMSWLVGFNVVNPRNRFVYMVMDVTYRLTEPALAPIRRYMPDLGGVDISPFILYLALIFVPRALLQLYLALTAGM